MFTKFAKNKEVSDLLAGEMNKHLENKLAEETNPFEEEFLEVEPASTDPRALETRHFHLPEGFEDEGVWGLDLDDEDLAGMQEDAPSKDELKVQDLMDKIKDADLSDEEMDKLFDMLGELAHKEESALLESDADDFPLSAAAAKKKSKKGKQPINPWAICNVSVGKDNKEKYERCVMKVKKQYGIKASVTEDQFVKQALPALPGEEADSLKSLHINIDEEM